MYYIIFIILCILNMYLLNTDSLYEATCFVDQNISMCSISNNVQ